MQALSCPSALSSPSSSPGKSQVRGSWKAERRRCALGLWDSVGRRRGARKAGDCWPSLGLSGPAECDTNGLSGVRLPLFVPTAPRVLGELWSSASLEDSEP